ncbi:DUF4391 domain-containing protein [Moraxella osloensis]|uniref:DUF4391 domain-containing protein n=1 Tax=Faucicola osloensis TaxID=34062 RepID=A0A6P1KKD8_FAUOS|nr:DUF4391 domain-containing protein [Moraxella osloensis]QHG10413.1 DUF4391 domain-containing protein [Moraxella osloensis]
MLYHYPSTAKVDKIIPKNKLYQRGSANHRIERLFVEQVESIRWAYKLSPHTINLNDSETIKEIQIFSIVSRVERLDTEVLQFIDKLIPSPIIFEIVFEDKIKVIANYKRQSQADSQKFVLGKYYATDWQDLTQREDLPIVFGIADLYEYFIEQLLLSTNKASPNVVLIPNIKANLSTMTQKTDSIEDKIAHAEKVALLTKQINELQKRIYKEKQFNRQVEMNLQLQTLQKQLKDLTR